jgi:hypothetical protein
MTVHQVRATGMKCRAPYDELLPALKAIEGDTAEDFVRSLLRTVVPIMHRRRAFLQLVLIDVQEFEGRTLASFLQTVAPRFLGVMLRLTSFPEVRADLSPSLIMRTSVSVGYLFTEIMADTTLMEGLPFPPVTGEAWLDGLVSILVHGLAADAEAKPCPLPEHT